MFLDTDYIDYIENEEDLKLFKRLKELEPILLAKKTSECLEEFKEAVQIDKKLKRKPPVVFIQLPFDPQLN